MHPIAFTSPPVASDMGVRPGMLVNPGQLLLWACDAKGHFEFFSPSWLAFTGEDFASKQGQGWLGRVLPEDRTLLWSDILEALYGESAWRRNFRLQRHDGEYRRVSMDGMATSGTAARTAAFTRNPSPSLPYATRMAGSRITAAFSPTLPSARRLRKSSAASRISIPSPSYPTGPSCANDLARPLPP